MLEATLCENVSMNENCPLTRYQVEAGVATITLQRPEAMNAFNAALRNELMAQIRRAEKDGDVRVVVLTGGAKAFSAGADLNEPYNPPHETVEGLIIEEYKPMLDAIAGSTKPYVAAVQGPAAGIGMSFALNCDLMLMAEEAYLYAAEGAGRARAAGAALFEAIGSQCHVHDAGRLHPRRSRAAEHHNRQS